MAVMAILTVFALIGCPSGDEPAKTPAGGGTITVTFDPDYDGLSPLTFTLAENEALGSARYAQVQAKEIRSGYEFKGWSSAKNGEPKEVSAQSAWAADAGYYGLWTEEVPAGQPITITYVLSGFPASQPAVYNATSGSAIGAAALPALSASDPAYTFLGWSTTTDGSVVTSAAVFNSNTTLYARYTYNGGDPPVPPVLSDIPFDLHPLRAAVPADFIRGVDISNCLEIEQHGGQYKNFDGQVEDIMKILTDNGINYVRIRLWVDPDRHPWSYPGDGNNKMEVTKAIAVRAKDAGMKFLLDYHYSDYWADPGKQQVPYAWKDAPNETALLDFLEDYTKETLGEFIAAGAYPDMVQIGNETPSGILTSNPFSDVTGNTVTAVTRLTAGSWGQQSRAFARASKAIRETAPNAKIMIQFDGGGDSGRWSTFENFTKYNGNNARYTEVDFDVIGMSWYSFWSSHRSIDDLYARIREGITKYGKEVVICESGFAYSFGEDIDGPGTAWYNQVPFKPGFGDNLTNVYGGYGAGTAMVGRNDVEYSGAAQMTNTNGFVSDSGVLFGTRAYGANTGARTLIGSPENQARAYRAFMDAVAAAGGKGVMWWGADWFAPVAGLASNVENAALFDKDGKALPALKVLGAIQGANVSKPGKITGLTAGTVSYNSASITWTTVNSAIASKYQLERASAADGPWTVCGDNLSTGTYSDTGLTKKTPYYYRVKGYNANGWGNYSDTLQITTAGFAPTGFKVTATTYDTVVLTWNALEDAAKYEVQRAVTAAGDFTTVKDDITGTTFTDTGRSPATDYYYRVRAYSAGSWDDFTDAVKATTAALAAPLKLRITGTDTASVTLEWNAVSAATSYKLYGIQSETAPADSEYTTVTATITTGTTYVHSGLTADDTWWYKISAVYPASYGEGLKSAAVKIVVGALDLTATVDMSTGTLDADFLDASKASSSTDTLAYAYDAAVYTIAGLYVANDNTNLYVALDFGDNVPAGFNHDRLIVWVSNTDSSAAGVTNFTDSGKLATTCNITGKVHGWAYFRMRAGSFGSGNPAPPDNSSQFGGSTGAAINATAWAGGTATPWVWKPSTPANAKVIKFSIPLAQIGGAVEGNSLKVLAAFSQGLNNGRVEDKTGGVYSVGIGSVIPKAVLPAGAAPAASDTDNTAAVDMNYALDYMVK